MANFGNWAYETCSTIGGGNLVLTGTRAGYSRWRDSVGSGQVYYVIEDGSNKEAGIGTFDGINVITRDTVLATIYNGVFSDSSPSALILSGSSVVASSVTKTILDRSFLADYITFTPYGDISSNSVRGAINELEDDKLKNTTDTFTGTLTVTGDASVSGAITSGSVSVGGDITVTGTVDGRDIAADGARLDILDSAFVLQGTWDASSGSFPGGGTAQTGYVWLVGTNGTVDGVSFVADDRITALTDNASTTTYTGNWYKSDYSSDVTSVDGLTGAVDLSSSYEPKNTNIQTHITSTSNPHSVTLQQATTAGNTTTNAITTGAHTVNGNITVTGTVDGMDVATDGAKLDGIEAGAEVNNISDADATDLTDGNDTNLHQHDTLENAGATKIAATSSGIEVTGSVTATNDVYAQGGLIRVTDNTNTYIDAFNNTNGGFRTLVDANGNTYFQQLNGALNAAENRIRIDTYGSGGTGAVKLYYGTPSSTSDYKLTTTSSGVEVTSSAETRVDVYSTTDSQSAFTRWGNNGVIKWRMGVVSDNTFRLYDLPNNWFYMYADYNTGKIDLRYRSGVKLSTQDYGVDITGVATSTGSPTADNHLTRKDYVNNIAGISILEYVTDITGASDQTTQVQSAIDAVGQGGVVVIPTNAIIRLDGGIILRRGVKLLGHSTNANSDDIGSRLNINHASNAILMERGAMIEGVTINRLNHEVPPSTGFVGWTGNAIQIQNNILDIGDVTVTRCNIFGFNYAFFIDSSAGGTNGRWRITDCNIDCRNGFHLNNVRDTSYITRVHMWPFEGNGVGGESPDSPRGKFIELGASVDWLVVTDCFSHSAKNFCSGDAGQITIKGGGWDYEEYQINTTDDSMIGIDIASPTNTEGNSIRVNGMTFNGGYAAIRVNNAATTGRKDRGTLISQCSFVRQDEAGVIVTDGAVSIASCSNTSQDGVAVPKFFIKSGGAPCAVTGNLYTTDTVTPFSGTNINGGIDSANVASAGNLPFA